MRFRNRGVTLLELVVAFSLFSVVGFLLVLSFTKSGELWRRTSGSSDSQLNLRKVHSRLSRDVRRTSFASVGTTPGLNSLGPEDGRAVWFLSAEDRSSGLFMRTATGTPFWQNNVLYYLAVPNNHEALFGITCSGGADADGFEVQCPHKVLIRKVIDGGTPTDPNDELSAEEPLTAADIIPYLTRPDGFDTSAMLSEPGVLDAAVVSSSLLSMSVELAPEPQWEREIRVELASVSLPTAQRTIEIGTVPLRDTVHESSMTLQLFPSLP